MTIATTVVFSDFPFEFRGLRALPWAKADSSWNRKPACSFGSQMHDRLALVHFSQIGFVESHLTRRCTHVRHPRALKTMPVMLRSRDTGTHLAAKYHALLGGLSMACDMTVTRVLSAEGKTTRCSRALQTRMRLKCTFRSSAFVPYEPPTSHQHLSYN